MEELGLREGPDQEDISVSRLGHLKINFSIKHQDIIISSRPLYEPHLMKKGFRDLRIFSTEKRRLKVNLINSSKFLKGGCQRDEARGRTRANRDKLEHRSFI